MMRFQKASFLKAGLISMALFLSAIVGGAPGARAQGDPIAGTGVIGAGWNQYLASEMIGLPVHDQSDDEIGEVVDLVTRNGVEVTGVVVRLIDPPRGDERDVLVSYSSAMIGANNRTHDRRDQDDNISTAQMPAHGRIQPSHILLPRLSAEDLAYAPKWPMGAWNGQPPTNNEQIAPGDRQVTFTAIDGVDAFDEHGRRAGTAEDLLADRDGRVDALILESDAEGRLIGLPIEAISFDETRRMAGGALTRPYEITITGITSAEVNRSPSFRID